ncbi:MAG: hypothetical protein OXR73_37490 [Myxococcales bacterium]|nr:hypothetical protein [Myxococcales bacterium]
MPRGYRAQDVDGAVLRERYVVQQLAHPLKLGGMRMLDHGRDKRALLGEVFAHWELFSSVFLVIHLREQSTLAFYFRLNPRTSTFRDGH